MLLEYLQLQTKFGTYFTNQLGVKITPPTHANLSANIVLWLAGEGIRVQGIRVLMFQSASSHLAVCYTVLVLRAFSFWVNRGYSKGCLITTSSSTVIVSQTFFLRGADGHPTFCRYAKPVNKYDLGATWVR